MIVHKQASVALKISVRKDPYRDIPSWMWHLDLVRPGNMPPLALSSGYAHRSEQEAMDTALAAVAELQSISVEQVA